jgi:hypothetical protein
VKVLPVREFLHLAELFNTLGSDLASAPTVTDALELITAVAVQVVEGAEHAGVTRVVQGQLETVAPTSELPLLVDRIQYELVSGPCVDAILERTVFRCDDLRSDERWPEFGRRAVESTGVHSMLSYRMFFEQDRLIAGLNLYASKPNAFTDDAETTGLLLTTHGALALTGAQRQEQIGHLESALASNRDIGMAMGILMARHLLTKQQAFDLLKVASQHTHRKLANLAQDVIEAGDLDFPRPHLVG